jgi:undecaprenyl-phosphate 4-deoxy-4-formamido-L-arabinose transferase
MAIEQRSEELPLLHAAPKSVTTSVITRSADWAGPDVSVIVPIYNEQAVLPALFERLYAALDELQRPYECVFIDDGSRDGSVALLRDQFQRRPEHTRVVIFQGNFGQHAAIMAGFAHMRGRIAVTIDADLQNPPEEIGKLLAKIDAGSDYVGSIRDGRKDAWWRGFASRMINRLRERTTHIHMTDHGCMLRAYDRSIVEAINRTHEVNAFVPALAMLYARHPTEVLVKHAERQAGESKYSMFKLIRLNFDLMTGFSVVALQIFSMIGMLISLLSGVLVAVLLGRRVVLGPEVDGVFTLFAIVFFLIGLTLFGIGLLGEYVGRISQQVRERPRFLVSAVLEAPQRKAAP